MTDLPACPACSSAFTYRDGVLLVCPECAHEWQPDAMAPADDAPVHKAAVGNVLADSDSVTVVKDLKVKGAGSAFKAEPKVRNHSLVNEAHNNDSQITGFGHM